MTSIRPWDRAGDLPVPADGDRPRAQVPALPVGSLPTVDELFTFMRDAELRFGALRMRIEERVAGVDGERLAVIETTLRHPGDAKVTTSEPALGTAGNYEVWISDGETVRTYSAPHKLATQRPVRRSVVGLEDRDLPGFSKVYRPLTALPMETLPETFVHPAGYCQNVLATGRCTVVGTEEIAGSEAVLIVCDHPRAIERVGDRPDFRIAVAVDRQTGVILRLVETIGESVTRRAEVTSFQPDPPLPPSAFEFVFPSDATFIY